MSILDLFYAIDDFLQTFAPPSAFVPLPDGKCHHQRAGQLAPSELMTILILFHHSHYRTFKHFY